MKQHTWILTPANSTFSLAVSIPNEQDADNVEVMAHCSPTDETWANNELVPGAKTYKVNEDVNIDLFAENFSEQLVAIHVTASVITPAGAHHQEDFDQTLVVPVGDVQVLCVSFTIAMA